jgi:hypothetical protein
MMAKVFVTTLCNENNFVDCPISHKSQSCTTSCQYQSFVVRYQTLVSRTDGMTYDFAAFGHATASRQLPAPALPYAEILCMIGIFIAETGNGI